MKKTISSLVLASALLVGCSSGSGSNGVELQVENDPWADLPACDSAEYEAQLAEIEANGEGLAACV